MIGQRTLRYVYLHANSEIDNEIDMYIYTPTSEKECYYRSLKTDRSNETQLPASNCKQTPDSYEGRISWSEHLAVVIF